MTPQAENVRPGKCDGELVVFVSNKAVQQLPHGLFCFNELIYLLWLCWVFLAVQRLSLIAAGKSYSLVVYTGFLMQ